MHTSSSVGYRVLRGLMWFVGALFVGWWLLTGAADILVEKWWLDSLSLSDVFAVRFGTTLLLGGSWFFVSFLFLWIVRRRMLAVSWQPGTAPAVVRWGSLTLTGLASLAVSAIGVGGLYDFLLWQRHSSFDRIEPVFGRSYDLYVYALPFFEGASFLVLAIVGVATAGVLAATLALKSRAKYADTAAVEVGQRLKHDFHQLEMRKKLWLVIGIGFLISLFGGLVPVLLIAGVIGWSVIRMSASAGAAVLPDATDRLRHLLVRLVGLFILAWGAMMILGRYQLAITGGSDALPTASWIDDAYVQWYYAVMAKVMGLIGLWLFAKPDRSHHLGRLSLGLIGLAVLLHGIVPSIVRSVYIGPNEPLLEEPYLKAHIEATRFGFGLDTVADTLITPAAKLTPTDVDAARDTLRNIRVWDYRAFDAANRQLQSLETYYTFADGDTDRYQLDGQLRQVLISARELALDNLPADSQQRWLIPFTYTHGSGVTVAHANRARTDGRPEYLVQDVPPVAADAALSVNWPELYIMERPTADLFLSGSIDQVSDGRSATVEVPGAVPMDSFARRLLLAVHNRSLNVLLSQYFDEGTQYLPHRTLSDRLSTLAPFITWDDDPYPVIDDGGAILWIVDGYTTSATAPLSYQDCSCGRNYMRNSVKAVIDAAGGSEKLYIWDATDPIARSWQQHFPDLFTDAAEMPDDVARHLRYAPGLFNVQSRVYNTYHMTEPFEFYSRQDAWEVPHEITEQGGTQSLMESYFNVVNLPDQPTGEFALLRPATAFNKENMVAWYAGRSDAPHTGELVVYRFPNESLVQGPEQVATRIDQDPELSKTFSLWNQEGSQVLRGGMYVLPAGQTMLYVQPIYLQSRSNPIPELKLVVLATQDQLAFAPTAEEALEKLLAQ